MDNYIGISENRLHHILGVARECYKIAKDSGCDEDFCRRMFMIGWNHDVGYECPILLKAGYLMYGDHREYGETGDRKVLNNLSDYYEGIGFINITDEVGGAAEAIIFEHSR